MSAIVVCPDCTTGPMGYAGNVYWRRCAMHESLVNSVPPSPQTTVTITQESIDKARIKELEEENRKLKKELSE